MGAGVNSAFPVTGVPFSTAYDGCGWQIDPEPGMTLRDYFAGQALAGIMANPERWKQSASDYANGRKTYEQCSAANAVKAYSISDAMLKARKTT